MISYIENSMNNTLQEIDNLDHPRTISIISDHGGKPEGGHFASTIDT